MKTARSKNMLAKQLEYLGGAEGAGIVLGARAPIILTSRADDTISRLGSCALAATLGGLDALVFTGGSGEHAAPIRARVCALAEWAGIQLDAAANEQHQTCISSDDSATSVWVVPTNEEWMIARQTCRVLERE